MADPAKPLLGDEVIAETELDPTWRDEIRRRRAKVEAGEARFVPAHEVLGEMRRLIDEHRKRVD